MRLDVALIRLHPGLSRRKAREVIEKGQVSVDGATVREPGLAVASSSEIRFDPNRKALPRARLSLKLLYQDDSLLVVDKPAGLLTVPTGKDAVEDTALGRVGEYASRAGTGYVGVVHRIDRDTSGAVAFALKPPVRSALRALFRAHTVERRYLAIVEGLPREEAGTIDAPIHDRYEGGRRRIARKGEPSARAVSRWRVKERLHSAALLEIDLETGRQHQIRIHLAHLGYPILGDRVYGTPSKSAARRQMLHAEVLGFVHPESGEPVRATSPLPEDMARWLAKLRR